MKSFDRLLGKRAVWPLIKQRLTTSLQTDEYNRKPFSCRAFDSAPLAPDYDLILNNQSKIFKPVSIAFANSAIKM